MNQKVFRRIAALLPLEEKVNKKSICMPKWLGCWKVSRSWIKHDWKVIWDFLTPLTFPHCLNRSPCLGASCPKTFLVGQVPLSPVCPMSRKVLKPVTTQRCGCTRHCPSLVRPAGRRWIGTGPAVWAISGPGLCYNKSIEATASAHSLPQAWKNVGGVFCRIYVHFQYAGGYPRLH